LEPCRRDEERHRLRAARRRQDRVDLHGSERDVSRAADWSFRIGARMGVGGPDAYFDGTIDEVRLYTRARSAAEIASDMSTELVASSPGFADLLSYWRFGEGAGTTAHDDKKAFDGTIKNGPAWVASDAF
jgi:hypothetical protein